MRQGILPAPFQKEFEISAGTQDFTCTFKGAQRQFDWVEISIVYDKSCQHSTIYGSYDLELAARLIKTVKFENTSSTSSLTGKFSYDMEKDDEKFLLYKMLVAFACNCCSSALLSRYRNNPIYQEITEEDEFGGTNKDDPFILICKEAKVTLTNLKKLIEMKAGRHLQLL